MAWPTRRIHLEKKGKARSEVGFGSLFVLLASSFRVQTDWLFCVGKETKCNFRPRGIRGYGGDNSCAWSLRIIHGAVIGWLLVVVKGRFFLTGGDPGY